MTTRPWAAEVIPVMARLAAYLEGPESPARETVSGEGVCPGGC